MLAYLLPLRIAGTASQIKPKRSAPLAIMWPRLQYRLQYLSERLISLLRAYPLQSSGTQAQRIFHTLFELRRHAWVVGEYQKKTETLLPFQQQFQLGPDGLEILACFGFRHNP